MRELLPNVLTTYTQGIVENSLPSIGQVAGRIESLLPVAEIMQQDGRRVRRDDPSARRGTCPGARGSHPKECGAVASDDTDREGERTCTTS